MKIDSHTHIGTLYSNPPKSLPKEVLLESMDKYGINIAVVSNGDSAEYDCDLKLLSTENNKSQIQSNKELLEFASKHENRFAVLLWLKPHHEKVDENLIALIEKYKDLIFGFKFHPFHSMLPFDDEKMIPYLDLALKYNYPILTHTASDDFSKPSRVLNMALKYPKLKFIMAHLELGSDNQEAINLMKQAPNLYADSAWVPWRSVKKVIKEVGYDRIMYGTDSPVDGIDTYVDEFIYSKYPIELRQNITENEYEYFMYKNAIKIYSLERVIK